jgi:hypothetical protein
MFLLSLTATCQVWTVSLKAGLYTYNVGVQVNQARRDDLVRYFMHPSRLFAGNGRCNTRNLAILDGNIVDAVQAGRWVYNGTTLE